MIAAPALMQVNLYGNHFDVRGALADGLSPLAKARLQEERQGGLMAANTHRVVTGLARIVERSVGMVIIETLLGASLFNGDVGWAKERGKTEKPMGSVSFV